MLIGIKLDIGFSENPLYRRLYGDREVLDYLKDLGLAAVETPIGLETGQEALRAHVAQCHEAGFQVSLHPYCEGTVCDPAFFSTEQGNPCRKHHERLLSFAAEISRVQPSPTIVNIHPAAGTSTMARRELVNRSVSFFTWAGRWCSQKAPGVRIVAELQFGADPGEPVQRIADTYDVLLEIVTLSAVPACWDFGHAYFNARRFGMPLRPPEALLQRIGHVHCHDVYHGDHCPLIYDTLPWRDFIRLLIERDYDDTIVIEVPPSAFLAAGGLESVSRSVEGLVDWIEQCKQEIH
jgi:sugar phosphate isomerase/epimerase